MENLDTIGTIVGAGLAIVGMILRQSRAIGRGATETTAGHKTTIAKIGGIEANLTTKIKGVDDKVVSFIRDHKENCPDKDGTLAKINDTLTDIKVDIGVLKEKS